MLKKAQFKYGIAGTSCSGKTTLAYALVSRLKSYGVLAEGVFSQDRKISFDKGHLDKTEIAQHWMVSNMIAKETEMSLHGDTDILVSDRTVLDFFAYCSYQYPFTELTSSLWIYVQEWCKTYDAIYLLNPLPYQADGKRPADEFRLGVDSELTRLAKHIPNAVYVERQDILNDIMRRSNLTKPNVKNQLTPEDIKELAKCLGRTVVHKHRTTPGDVLTDNDMYILVGDPLDEKYLEKVKTFVKGLFGPFCLIDLHLTNTLSTFDSNFNVYTPEGQVMHC
jgi:AAA domain